MKVNILTARQKLYSDEAMEVILPGEDGEFSIWDFHQPCIHKLRAGQIKVREKKNSPEKLFAINTGIAKVLSGSLTVMVESKYL